MIDQYRVSEDSALGSSRTRTVPTTQSIVRLVGQVVKVSSVFGRGSVLVPHPAAKLPPTLLRKAGGEVKKGRPFGAAGSRVQGLRPWLFRSPR